MYKNNSGFRLNSKVIFCTKFSAKLKGQRLKIRYYSFTKR